MSKRAKLSSNWWQSLRQQLEESRTWPKAADQLLYYITLSNQSLLITEEDKQMLALIVSDALNGVNIFKEYPNFYRKLLSDNELLETFLDILTLSEMNQTSKLALLPDSPSKNLNFLHHTPSSISRPLVENLFEHNKIVLRHAAEQIQLIFLAGLGRTPAFTRRGLGEEQLFSLLQDEVMLGDIQIAITLEATWQLDEPDVLDLILVAGVLSGQVNVEDFSLEANLHWGSYNETRKFLLNDIAPFPPIKYHVFWDEQQQSVTAELQLTIKQLNSPDDHSS